MKQVIKIISLITILFIIIADLLFLNWKVLIGKKEEALNPQVIKETNILPTPSSSCPLSCLSQIYEATSSLKLPLASPVGIVQTLSQPREFFISFGSGSTRAGDWEDITGLAVDVDSGKYGKIKTVVFEAAVSIPNGNQGVYVRLFNLTDNHPVWFSEVYHEGGTPKLLTSASITLDSGNKLYQVQMKTTLKDLVNLNQARIRITSE